MSIWTANSVLPAAALADNLKSVDSLVLGGPVNIGYVTPGHKSQTYQTNFYGNLDEVLLYNTTLTEAEVAAIYAAGRDGITLPVDTTGLTYLVAKAEALGEAAPADALATAKAVLAKQGATAQEVTEASDALLLALNALTDKTALRAAVEKADAMTRATTRMPPGARWRKLWPLPRQSSTTSRPPRPRWMLPRRCWTLLWLV